MATTIGELKYTIGLDDRPLRRGFSSAKSVLGRLDRAFGSLANISLAASGITTFGKTLFNTGAEVVKAAADMQKLEAGLRAVAGSSQDRKSVV